MAAPLLPVLGFWFAARLRATRCEFRAAGVTQFMVELLQPLWQKFGGTAKQEECMSETSGTIRPLYGVTIRDKCKSSDINTLKAYQTIARDLLNDHKGSGAEDLADALKDLDKAIAAKGKT